MRMCVCVCVCVYFFFCGGGWVGEVVALFLAQERELVVMRVRARVLVCTLPLTFRARAVLRRSMPCHGMVVPRLQTATKSGFFRCSTPAPWSSPARIVRAHATRSLAFPVLMPLFYRAREVSNANTRTPEI